MEEQFLTGYCRALDCGRTVTVEVWEGQPEADCAWPECICKESCPIAKRIEELEGPVAT